MRTAQITKEQALHAIEHHEFPTELISSKESVAVVMTQDWCSQWYSIQQTISLIENENLNIYVCVYNLESYFKEFLDLKENIWKNRSVPYIRYYKEGKLIQETNYVSKETFIQILGL